MNLELVDGQQVPVILLSIVPQGLVYRHMHDHAQLFTISVLESELMSSCLHLKYSYPLSHLCSPRVPMVHFSILRASYDKSKWQSSIMIFIGEAGNGVFFQCVNIV